MNRFRAYCMIACFTTLALVMSCTPLVQLRPTIANGGRAVAISVDPGNAANIVVASESGGLFRSSNTGTNWMQTSNDSTFGFSDVKHLPSNTSIVIAGAGADTRTTTGGGIWRSTDGGNTWSHVSVAAPTPDCAKTFSVYSLFAEATRNRVWAGTSCGLVSSDDSGATWQFLPASPGYTQVPVFAVVAPSASDLVILTSAGVSVSSAAGTSWTLSNAGLPGGILIGVHNQIAVSPYSNAHIYWAFNYWAWDASGPHGHIALFGSWDSGSSWNAIDDFVGINRPPFVKTANAAADAPVHYELYYADGGCQLRHATVTHGGIPTLSAWTTAALDHCDPADLAFDPADHKTPLLLASDGGLHRTPDSGSSWILTGAGAGGYSALQVTEVTGQLHTDRKGADLYFATQDNDLWASPDTGATWPGSRCCEGFFMNVWREPIGAVNTKLTGVSCSGCGNFIADPVLASQANFPNPPNNNGNPRLLKPGTYVHNTAISGLTGNVFDLSTDTGATWTPRYGFPEEVRDLSKVAGPIADPVVYTAVKVPGATPDGYEIVAIKRIAGVLGSGSPLVSLISGFGSLGIYATMFAWYKPFGVDPNDSNYLMVSDILDEQMKISTDAGLTWKPDPNLTNLVKGFGAFYFKWGPFSQASAFGFDPECPGHILVGSQQAGIFQTFDRGATWEVVKDSSGVPSVSSFFFAAKGEAIVSSYGRSLWRLSFTCPAAPVAPNPRPRRQNAEPTIYWKGAFVPISQIHDPDVCPVCGYFLTVGGDVVDLKIDPTGELRSVSLDRGELKGFTWDGKSVELSFQVTKGASTPGADRSLWPRLEEGEHIKGVYVDGRMLKGFILAREDLRADQLPRKIGLGPHIIVDVRQPSESMSRVRGPILIRGTGFDPRYPLTILLDGKPLIASAQPKLDATGKFSLAVPPALSVGGHTVLVEQRTPAGVIRDASTFVLSVADFPRQ